MAIFEVPIPQTKCIDLGVGHPKRVTLKAFSCLIPAYQPNTKKLSLLSWQGEQAYSKSRPPTETGHQTTYTSVLQSHCTGVRQSYRTPHNFVTHIYNKAVRCTAKLCTCV